MKYVLILIAYTLVSYLAAICLEKAESTIIDDIKRNIIKNVILSAAVVVVAGILVYFKYTEYFLMEIGNITRHFS